MGLLAPVGFKQVSRSVAADESALCWARFNSDSDVVPTTDAGDAVTAATIEVQANLLDFQVNGAAETVIGTYTGNTGADNQIVFADGNIASIENLINTINGRGTGHPAATAANYLRRWRAGLGDFRPQFVIGAGDGLAAGAANALLGRDHEGLGLLADSSALASANLISIGLGVPQARRGGGQTFPDHFESDFQTTTAGVKTPTRFPGRRQEEQPGQANFEVRITDLQVGALFATTKIATFFDDAGNTLKVVDLGAATSIPGSGDWSPENPFVTGPMGSPVWCEISGTGAFTDGTCTMSGYIRIV